MATLSATNLTLLDWAKRLAPDGNVAAVAELLSQTNDILQDAVFREGNLPTGHRESIRTGLPTAYWRAINAGIPSSKSTTAQVDEGCAILESRSHVDVELLKLNGNAGSFRASEDIAFIEAMNQTMAQTLFYGNIATDAKSFTGLATRYGALTGAGNIQNVLDGGSAGGQTDNTSVYLVVWGDQTVFCPFPKGSQAGLMHQDLGEESVTDGSGNWYQAARTLYQWKAGLVVKDWRYVVRIANIDVSNLVTESSNADLIKLMTKALYRIPNLRMGRPAFYVNRTVHEMLAIQALNKSQQVLRINEATTQYGTPHSWTSFLGVPIRCCDQILNSEARIT